MTALAVANIATIVAVLALVALAAQYVLAEVAASRETRRRVEATWEAASAAWDAATARAGGLLVETPSGTPIADAADASLRATRDRAGEGA